MTESIAGELERAVVDAWPAPEVEELDGWLLRASGGPTHRGNSVATLAAGSRLSLDERLAHAEHWYRARGREPMLQIGPSVALEQRGYSLQGNSVAAIAPSSLVLERTRSALTTSVEAQASSAWLAVAEGSSRHASSKQIFR